MNEPQVWTLVSVFSVAIFGVLGVVSGLFTQILRVELGKVAVEVRAIDKQLDGLRGEAGVPDRPASQPPFPIIARLRASSWRLEPPVSGNIRVAAGPP